MKLTFFKRVGEKIRHPFRKENTETVVVSEAVPQPEVDNAAEITINDVGVNLAVSFSCIVGCPICKIYLVDHGYRKFKEKIHFMEQYR